MNFLAHLFLSGNDEQLLIGNFIADHVKGKEYKNYPEAIQKGILLHRAIDSFTDSHPVVEKSKQRLRSHYHKYTPVIVDIFYDHFLASGWSKYHPLPLQEYATRVFTILQNNNQHLPERTRHMLVYMIEQNWILKYATLDGLQRVLAGMGQRARFKNEMHNSVSALQSDYDLFKNEFELFFEDLRLMVNQRAV